MSDQRVTRGGRTNLRQSERGVSAERHAFALRLLPVNFRQEQVVPVLRAMHVAGPQRRGEAVAVLSEQKPSQSAARLASGLADSLR